MFELHAVLVSLSNHKLWQPEHKLLLLQLEHVGNLAVEVANVVKIIPMITLGLVIKARFIQLF